MQVRAWRRASRLVVLAAGWLCVRCRAKGFTVAAALAHHRKPLEAGGAPLDVANLEAALSRLP